MVADLSIGFIGAGKMATALAQGFVNAGLLDPDAISASDIAESSRDLFADQTGGRVGKDNVAVVNSARILVLAVKPPQFPEVLEEICGHVKPDHLVVSIAAGVRIEKIESHLPDKTRVVRVMPNTPALVAASASAFALGRSATREDAALVQRLLSAVGLALETPEKLLDAVTGLSGSGPAYVYLVIEALSDGGVAAGLPRETATRLAAQTVLGAAKMVLETGQHPGALKDMVTSPGGTTIEAVHELEKAGIRAGFMNAVRAAARRAGELG